MLQTYLSLLDLWMFQKPRKKKVFIDLMLQKHHKNRKNKEEQDIFSKGKSNKNELFKFLKKKQKSKNIIGPSKAANGILDEDITYTLTKQYYLTLTELGVKCLHLTRNMTIPNRGTHPL